MSVAGARWLLMLKPACILPTSDARHWALTRDGSPDIAAGGQPVGPGRRGQIHAIAVPRSVREGADIVEVRVRGQQRPCERDEVGAHAWRNGDGARDAGGPTGEGATRGVGHVIEIGGPAWSLRTVSGKWLVEVGAVGGWRWGGWRHC